MNPHDERTLDIHRRTFLRYGLSGLGLLGLNSLMADQQALRTARSTRCITRPRPSASSFSTRPAARRTWRPSTTSRSSPRCTAKAMPESLHQRPADRATAGQAADLLRSAARVQEVRQDRPGDLRPLPAHRQRGRRRLHHPLDVDRADQSRPGAYHHEHRIDSSRAGPAWDRGCSTGWAPRLEDLPGFVVLLSAGRGGQMQPIAARQWSAGFLPSVSRASS